MQKRSYGSLTFFCGVLLCIVGVGLNIRMSTLEPETIVKTEVKTKTVAGLWKYDVDGVKLTMPCPPLDKESEDLAKTYLPNFVETPMGVQMRWEGGPIIRELLNEDEVRLVINKEHFVIRKGYSLLTPHQFKVLVEKGTAKYPDFINPQLPLVERVKMSILVMGSQGLLKAVDGNRVGPESSILVHNIVLLNWGAESLLTPNENKKVDSDHLRQDDESKKLDNIKLKNAQEV